jgi:hypothetical protein
MIMMDWQATLVDVGWLVGWMDVMNVKMTDERRSGQEIRRSGDQG